jgi:hypothetical protein
MQGILADINAEKHLRAILAVCDSDAWRDFWRRLGLSVESFPALGLSYDAPDTAIWKVCQRENLVLITGNRNDDGPDSLEAVIRRENPPESLPVITLGDPDRVLRDRLYGEMAAEQLLEYLTRIDEFLGTGRLYVP